MPRKKKHENETFADENFRIALDEVIREFVNDPAVTQYDFPANYSKRMRAYIHEKCQRLGLKSRSHGKEPQRILSILKKGVSGDAEEVHLELAPPTHQLLARVAEMPHAVDEFARHAKSRYSSMCKVFQGSTSLVPPVKSHEYDDFRKTLPIYQNRQLILDTIQHNQVVIISAETGSGKTTQVPQFIAENAAAKGEKVRVICTQPRRLSTIAVAERVAAERGERVGSTVGYQIKLESKLGLETAIVYCTNGVLLRTLMSNEECFGHISHIIVDEIHERDKFTDFLMITLRTMIQKQPHLRLLLMSATMDMEAFVNYFDNQAFVLSVEGRNFSCFSWFLEDILHQINYENQRMKELRMLRERNGAPPLALIRHKPKEDYAELDEDCKLELNDILARCFDNGSMIDFDELMQMYLNENVNPNYQDWGGKTALMAASRHANIQIIEQLLNMGADMFLSSAEGITASGWAQQANNLDVVNMLTLYQQTNPVPESICAESGLLADYDRTVNDEYVDYDLIVAIIKYIHYNLSKEGAILVFLPGYEDIVSCHERIGNCNMEDIQLFMLHSSMQIQAQHSVFKKFPNQQKIILSTNIAETSITIDDVRFVIDSGKAKIKNYDARTGISSLKSEWISMANSRQRAGRAGRTQNGYCFHLYSVNRYESFCVNPTPEILRTPLYELCLQTKMLAPETMAISEFLDLAINPPSSVAVEEAITTLKCLGALNEEEEMTQLGNQLVQLSIEPRLGKMLIFGVILRCLDPILTITASLAQKDPFMLPSQANLKAVALNKRRQMAENSLSDHLIFIRAFQLWQEHTAHNRGYQFCNNNFISPGVMELIMQTRMQLLSQLRAMGFVHAGTRDSIADLNYNSHVWPVVKCCLAAGLYPNVAFYNGRALHTKIANVVISAQSSIKDSLYDGKGYSHLKQAWLIFDEISKPRIKTAIKSVTVISPLTVALICGQQEQVDGNCLLLDESYALVIDNPLVLALRHNIQNLIYQKILNPYAKYTGFQLDSLRVLMDVLLSEDSYYQIKAPDGIGERPLITHMQVRNKPQTDVPRHMTVNTSGASTSQRTPGGGGRRGANRGGRGRGNGWTNGYHPQQQQQQQWAGDDGSQRFQSSPPTAAVEQLFPLQAKYFVIRPFEEKHVIVSIKQRFWTFSLQTEKKLFKCFTEGHPVLLVFYVHNMNELFGIAKLVDHNYGQTCKPCPLEWITTNKLPLFRVKNNILSGVHLQEDGQQLDGPLGQKLCARIYEQGSGRSFNNHHQRGGGGGGRQRGGGGGGGYHHQRGGGGMSPYFANNHHYGASNHSRAGPSCHQQPFSESY